MKGTKFALRMKNHLEKYRSNLKKQIKSLDRILQNIPLGDTSSFAYPIPYCWIVYCFYFFTVVSHRPLPASDFPQNDHSKCCQSLTFLQRRPQGPQARSGFLLYR